MATKEELVSSIKEWIKLEDEMKLLQAELKSRRIQKKMLSDKLVDVMKNNEIDCFDMAGGKLMYTTNVLEHREVKIKEGVRHKPQK